MNSSFNVQPMLGKFWQKSFSIHSGIFLGLCCSLFGIQSAQAASFSFTKIADNQNSLLTGYNYWNGAINDQGTVAFYAGSGGGEGGIFKGQGKKISTIFNQDILADFYPNPYPPDAVQARYFIYPSVDINDQNIVAFAGRVSLEYGLGNGQAIFIADDKNKIKMVTGFGPSGRFEGGALVDLNLNNQNSLTSRIVAGGAFLSPTDTITLYNNITQSNQSSTTVAIASITNAPTGGLIDLGSPSLNNQGTVAFSALFRDIHAEYPLPPITSQLIMMQKGGFQTVVTNNIKWPSQPVVNDNNEIAFLSSNYDLFSGDEIESGIFTFKNGNLTKAVNNQGLFGSFESLDINNKGNIAFSATLDTGTKGIFIGADPVADKVITVGDSLFGSTITNLSFFADKGLNDQGQIAFYAALEDGRTGIFRADPAKKSVPEPTSVLGLLALGVWGLSSRRKSG
ncbi:MAG: PEP-CTERM sorting domain-containing protein [Planktothrix sp. GU0601_MAG3]|nr:MAG: PEP-CTERM sorting domain-containing protein [Planktothrix sp. GU0601_MAG3]